MPESPSLKLVADNTVPPPVEDAGLDPVSEPRFSDIVVEPEHKAAGYYPHGDVSAPPSERKGDFSPMTWVMIVVAGIALGIAVAMMLASL